MYLKLNIHQAFYIECVYMNFFFIEFMQIINSEMYIESQRTGTKIQKRISNLKELQRKH